MEYKKVQGAGFESMITGENMCFLLLASNSFSFPKKD
jgi:hypothetical protein